MSRPAQERGDARLWRLGPVLAIALLGCQGEPASSTKTTNLRTLTPDQYVSSLRAMFGDDLPTEAIGPRTTSLASGNAGIGSITTLAYESNAFQVAAWAFEGDEERRAELAGCEPQATQQDPCLRAVLARFGRLAFRRALRPAELDRYVALASKLGSSDPWRGLGFAVAALLQSPHFLYRVERIADVSENLRYAGTTIASRLAYFIWNEAPDHALLTAAEQGEIKDAEGIAAVVAGMLNDPRADEGRRRLLAELFHLELLDEVEKDPLAFPDFDEELRAAMAEQLQQTLGQAAKEGSLASLFTTRETFLNDRLAALYGHEGNFGPELSPVTLAPDHPQAGALTLPAVLSSRSYPGHTSVALRGLFVRRDFLCQDIPPPPPEVIPTLRPPQDGELITTRELLEEHQNNESCWGCHSQMDPIGLALEQFDAVGRFREMQNGLPIDPSGDLDGTPFTDALGLGQALADHPRLDPCFATNIYSYAVGRTIDRVENTQLAVVIEANTSGRLRLDEVMLAIATSDLFVTAVVQP